MDTGSWVLVVWELEQRGLVWDRVVLDGGAALQSACRQATPTVLVQGDTWHELHGCAQVQQRLERVLQQREARTPAVADQADRIAAGHGRADATLRLTWTPMRRTSRWPVRLPRIRAP